MIVGADSDYAIERAFRKYLSVHPSIVALDFFPAQNLFLEYYRKSLFNKIRYRIGLSRILASINLGLLKRVDEFRPDMILFFKGMEIYPGTLKKLSLQGIKLVNYNPDNPFIFSGRGSGNRNVTRSVSLFDLYLSYDIEVCERLMKESNVVSGLLPFGFEIDERYFQSCGVVPEVIRTCFVGNPDKQRCDFINNIAGSGVKIDVYGNRWEKWPLHENISIKGYLQGLQLWEKLRAYRVQLNLLRSHNEHSHNMRTFEIPAIGGIQLAPDTPDHRLFFKPSEEIFLFNEITDCVDTINRLLALPVSEAEVIRIAARKRSVESGYSYRYRTEELVSLLEKYIYCKTPNEK